MQKFNIKYVTIIGISSILLTLIASAISISTSLSAINTKSIDLVLEYRPISLILNSISAIGIIVFFAMYFLRQNQWTKFKIINLICLIFIVLMLSGETINYLRYDYGQIANNSYSFAFAVFSFGLFLSKPNNKLLINFSLITAIICVVKFISSFIRMEVLTEILYSSCSKIIMLIFIMILLSIMLKMQLGADKKVGE